MMKLASRAIVYVGTAALGCPSSAARCFSVS